MATKSKITGGLVIEPVDKIPGSVKERGAEYERIIKEFKANTNLRYAKILIKKDFDITPASLSWGLRTKIKRIGEKITVYLRNKEVYLQKED